MGLSIHDQLELRTNLGGHSIADNLKDYIDRNGGNSAGANTIAELIARLPESVDVQPLTVTENGTYTAEDGFAYNPVEVDVKSGGGGSSAASKDVNFIDYDGTIVYSYTADEFTALTAMPENPTHEGLTSQGWNWSLADAQTYVSKYGKLVIGQMYITDDGKTRVYIHLEEGRTSPLLGLCPNGTVDVDWGDGSAHDTLTGTSVTTVKWTPNHAYAEPGDYVITLTPNGTFGFYGYGSSNQYSGLLRYTSGADGRNHSYQNAIQRVHIGDGVTSISAGAFHSCLSLVSVTIPDSVKSFDGNAFQDCQSLASVAIPDGVTSIGTYMFSSCPLASVAIPDGVTSIGSYAFYNCRSFASVAIPDVVTSIGSYAFQDCQSLASVAIPDGVTSIGAGTFLGCISLAFIRFESTTPPTVSHSSAFTNVPTDCKIYVPSGSLSAYTSATNYPSSSMYTYVEY